MPNKIRSECSGVAWKDSFATLGRFDVADIVEADAPKQRQTSCDYLRLRTFDEAKRRLRRHGRNFEEALARYQGCDPHWQGPVEPMRNSILAEAKSTPRSAKLQPQTLPLRLGKTVNGLYKSRAGWAEIFLACPAAVVQNRQLRSASGFAVFSAPYRYSWAVIRAMLREKDGWSFQAHYQDRSSAGPTLATCPQVTQKGII